MKKISKIITAILVLSIIFGALVVAVSAFTRDGNLVIAGDSSIKRYKTTDFTTYYDGSGTSNYVQAVTNSGQTATVVGNANKYYRWTASSAGYKAAASPASWIGVNTGDMRSAVLPKSEHAIINNNFIVSDFEFSTDTYVYEDANGNFTFTETDGAKRPAYLPSNLNYISRFYFNSGSKAEVAWLSSINVISIFADETDPTKFYIGTSSNRYELPSEIGVWTHVSFVLEIDNDVIYGDTVGEYDASKSAEITGTELKNSKLHIYINGELLLTQTGIFNKYDAGYAADRTATSGLDSVRFQTVNPDKNDAVLCLDNVTTHYYQRGYEGELADYFADGSYKTEPLFTNSDVIYSGEYLSPNGAAGTVDGKEYSIEAALFDAAKEGSTVVLGGNIGTKIFPKASFTLVSGGYNFTIDPASGYVAELQSEGTYLVRALNDSEKGTVVFDVEGGDLYASVTAVPGATVKHPTANSVDLINKKLLLGWTTTKGSTTPENIVAGAAGTTVTAYPIYDSGEYEYVIICGANELFYKGADIKTLITDFNIARNKRGYSEVTVILGADVNMVEQTNASGETLSYDSLYFAINAKNVYFDLNGYDLMHCDVSQVKLIPTFSYAGNDGHLYLYSSKPGADLINLGYLKTSLNSAGVLSCPANRERSAATIGNGTDNLTIHTSILGNLYSADFVLSINGGSILAPRENSLGLIISRTAANISIDIKNALIAGQATLFCADASGNAKFNGTIDNCVLSAKTIFGNIYGSTIKITNTDLIGGMTAIDSDANPGQIILGDGCRCDFVLPANGNVVIKDGHEAFEKTATQSISYSVYFPQYDNNSGFTEESLSTPIAYTVNATHLFEVMSEERLPKKVKVTWNHPNGYIIAIEECYVGTTAKFKGELPDGERVDGWFIESILGWNDKNGGSDFVVSETNNEFMAVVDATLSLDAYYNYTTTTGFNSNLYIPVPSDIGGVVIKAIYEDGVDLIGSDRVKNVSIGEKEFIMVSAPVGVYQSEDFVYTVAYTYRGEAATIDVCAKNLAYYFEKVLAANPEDVVLSLIAHSANYCKAVMNYVGYATTPYDAIVAEYSSYINEVGSATIKADKVENVSSLSAYIEGVTFAIGDGFLPIYAFAPAKNSGVTSVQWSYNSYNGNTYTNTAVAGEHWGDLLADGGSIGVYDVRKPITITYNGISGTYSLAAYIDYLTGLEGTADANPEALAVVKALYAYSFASYKYKTRCIHAYDHEYDATCNYCGREREIRMQSVLLIGQSNMVGVGDLTTVEPIYDERLYMMRGDKWVTMQEPLHTNSYNAGAGIGASFGKAFVESFGCNVGLIPAAEGATTLEMWAVGGRLYNEAVRLAKLAQETSDIAAILWHQGEGNQNSRDYAELLKVILDSMLYDLGLDPDKIVIVTGELFGNRSDAVHHYQLELLGEHYKNYGIAESDGLTVSDVTTHFDAPSLRVFGYRYFDIFYKIKTGNNYEYDDNPENYWVNQKPAGEGVYANVNFDSAITGDAYTGLYDGSTIQIDQQNGEVAIVEDASGGKYISVSNGYNSETGAYTSTWMDGKYTTAAGPVLVLECKIKLGENHKSAANLLFVTSEAKVSYESIRLAADGAIDVVTADGASSSGVYASSSEWTTIRIVLDFGNNLKDIYINDQIVVRGGAISKTDVSSEVIVRTRIIQFNPRGAAGTGTVLVDDYRCYLYSDTLAPAAED